MNRDTAVVVKKKLVACKATGVFPLSPVQIWGLLALEESKLIFRVEARKQLSFEDSKIIEQVTFVAPVRILIWKNWARTEVHQTVDLSDSSNVRVNFRLMHSDMMSHLHGSWHFKQLEAPTSTSLGSTHVTYCFEMWPKGVPTALRFMPGLLDAVKAAVGREANQLFDKLAFVASKMRPGMSLVSAARQASGDVEAAGGSFKCVQLLQQGNVAEAAAAAASEAAARQLLLKQQQQRQQRHLQQQQQQQQQEKQQQRDLVVGHKLDDVLSDCGDDDCLMTVDNDSRAISTMPEEAADSGSESGSENAGRVSSSSGGSSSSSDSSGGGSSDGDSSGDSSEDGCDRAGSAAVNSKGGTCSDQDACVIKMLDSFGTMLLQQTAAK